MYTSRSAIECYNCVCKHKRYVQYLLDNGIGIVSSGTDISLIFGQAIHIGIENLLQGIEFEKALPKATDYIVSAYESNSFADRKSADLAYSFEEHKALLTALLYSYFLSEYEYIASNYNVIATEQEFKTLLSYSDKYKEDIYLLSRVDAILQHKETGDIHIYSVKSDKDFYYQVEESHSNDLQGLTEIWATEQWGKKLIPYKQEVLESLCQFADDKAIKTIRSYLDKKYPTFDKVSAVRFCHLIKGKRWNNDDGSVHTLNSLIYGYRKATNPDNPDNKYAYAHSYSYQNTWNKSGQSRLGKGWEKFKIWEEYPKGVIGWIDDITDGLIQPDEENPVRKSIIVPEPFYRDDSEVIEAIEASAYQEVKILEDSRNKLIPVTTLFPKNRKSCNYPVICEYKDYCFRPSIQKQPIESGLYKYRVSHHKEEATWQDEQLTRNEHIVNDVISLLSKSVNNNYQESNDIAPDDRKQNQD